MKGPAKFIVKHLFLLFLLVSLQACKSRTAVHAQKQNLSKITELKLCSRPGSNERELTNETKEFKQPLENKVATRVLMPKNSYLIDSNETLIVSISSEGYTRLTIENERITDVFVYPQEALGVKIHDQGYLVMVPKQDEEGQAEEGVEDDTYQIYLTVTGERGTTQDFALKFTGATPAPVKFVNPISEQQFSSINYQME